MQHVVNWGHTPTIFQRLLMLPFAYFSSRRQRNVLFPTLLSLVINNRRNLHILQAELSTEMLIDFIKELQSGKIEPVEVAKIERTFPRTNWESALEFLASGGQITTNAAPITTNV
jgi:hypothetical protein